MNITKRYRIRLPVYLLLPIVLAGCANPFTWLPRTSPVMALETRLTTTNNIFHGNYCGRLSKGEGFELEPTDNLDAACKRHDMCYAAHNDRCGCDATLRTEAQTIRRDESTPEELLGPARVLQTGFVLPFCKIFPDGFFPQRAPI